VIRGTKWAANLWVWNGPRNGYMVRDETTGKMRRKTAEERRQKEEEEQEQQGEANKAAAGKSAARKATFSSYDVSGASLFWEDQFWSKIEIGVDIDVNTFVGHKWYVELPEHHHQ